MKHDPSAHERGEHTGDDPDTQRRCKTLDWTGSKLPQDKGGNERCYIGVKNSRKRAFVPAVDSASNGLRFCQLFTDALKNEHVGIDGHTDRKNQPGDTRQRQCSAKLRENGQYDDEVKHESRTRQHSGQLVIDKHKNREKVKKLMRKNSKFSLILKFNIFFTLSIYHVIIQKE